MSRKLALLTFFALSMLLLPLVTVAQVDRGSIKGVVHDEQNAVVPNATLVLKNESTGVELNSRSLSSGEYSFVSLPAGNYFSEEGRQSPGCAARGPHVAWKVSSAHR